MSGHPEDAAITLLTGVYRHYLPPGMPEAVELDLGCGSGGFTAALAARYPESAVVAADVMIGRLRKVVRKIRQARLENVDVIRVEARVLLGLMMPDASLNRIHILCPDPWPKNRHRGNRLLCADFSTQLHRVLKPGGVLHFSSDDEAYCDAVDRVIGTSGLFELFPEGIADLAEVRSDFERRWLAEGKTVHHRAWRRLPLPVCTIGH
ncbi:MAG: methyltransferase domain-containing protein [Lentisphaeria bacterium]|nr:methyltransferase domain-containing protein [Lentisphaeria bacterium]